MNRLAYRLGWLGFVGMLFAFGVEVRGCVRDAQHAAATHAQQLEEAMR